MPPPHSPDRFSCHQELQANKRGSNPQTQRCHQEQWSMLGLLEAQRKDDQWKTLNEYTTTVTDFISKCAEDSLPKKSIQTYQPEATEILLRILLHEDLAHPCHSRLGVLHTPHGLHGILGSVFPRVKPRKAMGPDGVPGRALRCCVDQLGEVFTAIFNLALLQAEVPTCFKKTTIIS
eukprot:g37222.t1